MAAIRIYLSTWCPYCQRALSLLDAKGEPYEVLDVDTDPALRREMVERAGRTSVPQIWIGARHVGGYDDLAALDRAGELDALLAGG